MTSTPPAPGMVWDIFENDWVTLDYWQYVNQRGPYAPGRQPVPAPADPQ